MNKILKPVLVLLAVLALAGGATARQALPGKFDYLVLALSWSPTYCASNAGKHDESQCAPGRNFAFVVHGLWPQFEQGWPENCLTEESWVPQEQIDAMMDIMPSKKLIIHEWKKHGSCLGGMQADYFSKTRQLFEKVKIPARYLSPTADVITTPEQLVTDFVKTNVNLSADMLSVSCGNARDRARLAELRVCMDRDGKFAQCGRNERRACQARELVMPRVR